MENNIENLELEQNLNSVTDKSYFFTSKAKEKLASKKSVAKKVILKKDIKNDRIDKEDNTKIRNDNSWLQLLSS